MPAHEEIETIIAMMRKAADAIYERGYANGKADAFNAIMRTASANMGMESVPNLIQAETPAKAPEKASRAPRGAVRQAVVNMLTSIGGKGATTSEIIQGVHGYSDGVEISGISASNELHRQKGILYSQDSTGHWHLIDEPGEKEKPVDDRTVESPSTGLFETPAQGREAGPGGGA